VCSSTTRRHFIGVGERVPCAIVLVFYSFSLNTPNEHSNFFLLLALFRYHPKPFSLLSAPLL
jgi:hypothetical protein